jgi:hypothetical protein
MIARVCWANMRFGHRTVVEAADGAGVTDGTSSDHRVPIWNLKFKLYPKWREIFCKLQRAVSSAFGRGERKVCKLIWLHSGIAG